jgi:hypothetical protein
MSSEKSDDDYDLHVNCFSRGHDDLVQEFITNSKLLSKRKNGNYLYHEIVSILMKDDIDQKQARHDLRDIAERYIEMRCPRNMVYGCLHEDQDHNLHYHLMISANERGESKRMRLTQKQFDTAKRNLENHVLEHYPHLEQPEIINVNSDSEKMSVKAGEVKRRMGVMPIRDEIKKTLQDAMAKNHTMNDFVFHLSEHGYQFYTRGKNFGVEVQHENGKSKKYRFSTLGIHEVFENFQNDLESKQAQNQYSHDVETLEDNISTSDIQEKNKANIEPENKDEEILERSKNTDHTSEIEESITKSEIFSEKLKNIRNEESGTDDSDEDESGNNV